MLDLSQLISRLVEENDDFNELEDGLIKELFEVGRKVLRGILEHMDAELMKSRAEGLRHLGVRERTVLCLLYTSDAADDLLCVDLGGRRITKKKKNKKSTTDRRATRICT